MLDKKISSYLVTGEGHEVIGIITTDDLLVYLADLLKDERDEKVPFMKMILQRVDGFTQGLTQ